MAAISLDGLAVKGHWQTPSSPLVNRKWSGQRGVVFLGSEGSLSNLRKIDHSKQSVSGDTLVRFIVQSFTNTTNQGIETCS
jgi:hypothetical protein